MPNVIGLCLFWIRRGLGHLGRGFSLEVQAGLTSDRIGLFVELIEETLGILNRCPDPGERISEWRALLAEAMGLWRGDWSRKGEIGVSLIRRWNLRVPRLG